MPNSVKSENTRKKEQEGLDSVKSENTRKKKRAGRSCQGKGKKEQVLEKIATDSVAEGP